jgi:ZIP family zinc transporter
MKAVRDLDVSNIWLAVGLTVLAGLSTGIGGLFVFLFRQVNAKVLSVALGFSAGVMIYVSFVEIFFESRELLVSSMGEAAGSWTNILAFFGGMILIALIDNLIPSQDNPHESHKVEDIKDYCGLNNNNRLLRTGMFTALVITIHNFPEGMATFVATIQQPSLGIAIAIAIAIHNIPEGMAVAIPVYCSTGSRKKALELSFLSGLAEPVGAIMAYLILMPVLNDIVFGILFAGIAGIMVFISLDELLPAAREYGEHHLSIYGLIAGMIVMALSLLLFISR